jgi:hypothetical protein
MVINGYKIPGGKGGLAVRIAADLIAKNPGIKQAELLSRACNQADLNLSTSGWITSPGDKSPAMKLWTRKKEGRGFCLYPNEWTQEAAQSLGGAFLDYVNKHTAKSRLDMAKWFGREPRVGDLFQLDDLNSYHSGCRGVLIGFKVTPKLPSETPSSDNFLSSIDEALLAWNSAFKSDPDFNFVPQSITALMLKEDGRLGFYYGGFWLGRLISDPPPVWKIQVKNDFVYEMNGYTFVKGQTVVKIPNGNFYFNSPPWGERSDASSWKTNKDAQAFLEKIVQDMKLPPDVLEVVLI